MWGLGMMGIWGWWVTGWWWSRVVGQRGGSKGVVGVKG